MLRGVGCLDEPGVEPGRSSGKQGNKQVCTARIIDNTLLSSFIFLFFFLSLFIIIIGMKNLTVKKEVQRSMVCVQ